MTTSLATSLLGESLYHEQYHPPFLPVLAIVPFFLPAFWNYSVDVTDENLSFGYSWNLTRKSVDRSMISSAIPVKHINGLTQWGGWGIRLNFSGETGYVSTNGSGVRISIHNGKKRKDSVYVFNCEDPDKVCVLLNSTPK